ncbi:MAG: hypothetical protein JRJ69_02295 [Deltaproteobacteria bacterium]|nr:hypothetical protein [Deltaproteobacteria bacterium]MBW1736397.1 hypothetical protein [Deltaproteobacteria bacterium]MBW1908136.1 hypothetical protein [Deltaproteobacteria bacterium]MBW2032215.1 hypothetical protein [Deltaproteobacteria bacterium]MBW2113788.1 hypothetical protein [Deltaproteobacteria bacterium]
MVEKIEIQKGFAPISSTAKVRNVKKQNPNMNQRRFDRQLQEEENKKRKQGKHTFEDQEINDEKVIRKQMSEPDNMEDPESDMKSKTRGNTQGKLIDIIV